MGSLVTCCKTCNCPRETDTGPGRRRILNENQFLPKESSTVKITTEYIKKPDGTSLFGKLFEPKNPRDAKAMICYCIGFADNIEWLTHDVGCKYAEMGFIVFMCDWKGHGRSDGDFVHVQDFDVDIVDEGMWAFDYVINKYIKSHEIYADTIHKTNNYFISGASMGGAIAIKIALKSANNKWKGLVAVCPMIGIAEEAKPPQCAISCLRCCCLPCCPKAKLLPNGAGPEGLTSDLELRALIEENPLLYQQRLSLITGWNLFNVTECFRMDKVKLNVPLFIGHGNEDKVTDCNFSKDFYENCGCHQTDKTIKIYEGRGHALYQEEPDCIIDTVEWIKERIEIKSNIISQNTEI